MRRENMEHHKPLQRRKNGVCPKPNEGFHLRPYVARREHFSSQLSRIQYFQPPLDMYSTFNTHGNTFLGLTKMIALQRERPREPVSPLSKKTGKGAFSLADLRPLSKSPQTPAPSSPEEEEGAISNQEVPPDENISHQEKAPEDGRPLGTPRSRTTFRRPPSGKTRPSSGKKFLLLPNLPPGTQRPETVLSFRGLFAPSVRSPEPGQYGSLGAVGHTLMQLRRHNRGPGVPTTVEGQRRLHELSQLLNSM